MEIYYKMIIHNINKFKKHPGRGWIPPVLTNFFKQIINLKLLTSYKRN